jgi:probable phosphoglycerate mutase
LTSSEVAARDPKLYQQWRASPATVRPPGGETLEEAAERAVAALDDVIARREGRKVVLVMHNMIIRVLVCHALGAELSTVGRIKCQPGSISVVDIRGDRHTVRLLNDTCHLENAGDGP